MCASNLKIRTLVLSAIMCALPAIPARADSHARIVRLSDIQGDVQVDRNTGQGYEKAFLNLPLTQGVKLRSGDAARAELELEDGSAVRIAANSVIEVPELSLRDTGVKVTTIHLQEGTAYVNFLGTKDSELTLTFAREHTTLVHAAHLRIELGDTVAELAVFKGDVEVDGHSGAVAVEKNHTAKFDLADDDRYKLAKNIEADPYDAWDSEQSKYREHYSTSSYSSYSPYSYGTADLQYYGNFFDAPGYGTLWQPYFVGAGWDPFMNGAWAFWPGFGYGWVSGYPWGWTPYHYGTWQFVPGYGWAWQPGGTWMGWNAVPVFTGRPPAFMAPRPPASPGKTIVAVNQGPLPTRQGRIFPHLQVPTNSAGLGIERGSVKNLADFSRTAVQRGSVNLRAPEALSGWRGGDLDSRSISRSGWSASRTSSSATSAGHSSHVGGSSAGHVSSGGRR